MTRARREERVSPVFFLGAIVRDWAARGRFGVCGKGAVESFEEGVVGMFRSLRTFAMELFVGGGFVSGQFSERGI
jgi:hypothetical protein